MFNAHQKFDSAVLRPVALGYKHAVPRAVRAGVHNALSNLTEPIVFLNFLLQFKLGKAAETLARFVVNSTIGLGGLIDVARTRGIDLPHRPNGFGDTLGFYGVGPGPYLFLPFVGPTDLRDFLGGQGDALVLPLAVGKPFDRLEYQIPKAVVSGLDQRVEADADLEALFASAVDPYATLRSVYLQDRAGEIAALKGQAAAAPSPIDTDLTDPEATPAPRAPTASELDDPQADPAAPPAAPVTGDQPPGPPAVPR